MLNYFFMYPIIWMVVLALYIMDFSLFNNELNLGLILFIIITSLISLILGIIFRKKFKFKKDTQKHVSSKPIIFIIISAIIDFICMKQIPLVSIVILKTQNYSLLEFTPILHIVICSVAMYYSIVYFYNAICDKINRKKSIINYLIIIFIFLLYYTRSFIVFILLISIIMFLSYLISEKKINYKHIILSVIAIIILLYGYGGLGNLRHGYKWNDNSYIEEIGLYTSFPKFVPKQFMWAYSYITSPLANLNYNVTDTEVTMHYGQLIKELLPMTISKRIPIKEGKTCNLIKPYFNVSTGYCISYVNGSFIGMSILFIFMMLLGCLGVKYSNKNLHCDYTVFCSITSIVFVFMFFDNMLSYVGVSIPFWISFVILILNSNKIKLLKFKKYILKKIKKCKINLLELVKK